MGFDSGKLLASLQQEALQWPLETLEEQYNRWREEHYPPGSIEYINEMNARYNLETMLELKHHSAGDFAENIPVFYYRKFVDCINGYMDKYAPGQEELKTYIRILNLYRTFVAKMPLHPPGMIMPGGNKVYKKCRDYFCTAKQQYIHEEESMCRFCVAKMCEY